MRLSVFLCLVTVTGLAIDCRANDLAFRVHPIAPEAENCAAAAMDVNQDGKVDVVSGGWWYAAPDWTRRFVREVEVIRGRLDDYSNLAVDVNGDGRLDLISANYRSSKIYWIEQPADPLQPWVTHLVAEPGKMETARLVDINSDGRLDLLPNGIGWAAWWEFRPLQNSGDGSSVEWIRHELPRQLSRHGIGAGDLNGDGRIDIVGQQGWAEALPPGGDKEWEFHAEFRLHVDASIPILVFDVDGDGDTDIVWGRGHNAGLYWLEQTDRPGWARWQRHAIDTSFAQLHSLLLADLDGDGKPEVIAGKRYLGHDGKDAGEWDPLLLARYEFVNDSRTWSRQVLASGDNVGWGLDPKATDLDGDGDLDLLCPSRAGLYWVENQGPASSQEPSPEFRDDLNIVAAAYPDHRRVMQVQPAEGALRPVVTPQDWGLRRAHLRANLQRVMGTLPEPLQRVPLAIEVLSEESAEGYRRQKITFTCEPGDRVPAYLLLPNSLGDEPQSAPAMLCLHQTTGIGKGEPAGLGGLPNLHYAHELAQRGYICIVPDYPSFGDYAFDFKAASHYASGSMKAIWNNLRAVDVLEQVPQVDPDRIGVIGHSLGGHNALFTAVFDLRLKAVISSCGYTAFHDYYGGKLAGWTSDRYMPRIRDVYHNSPDEVPFDFPEIVAALAPRAFFSNSPISDANFDVGGVRTTVAEARQVYELLGVPTDRLRLETPDAQHDFPPEIRQAAYQWLEQQLR